MLKTQHFFFFCSWHVWELGSQERAHSVRVSCGWFSKETIYKMWSGYRETTTHSTVPRNCYHSQATEGQERKWLLESRKSKFCKRRSCDLWSRMQQDYAYPGGEGASGIHTLSSDFSPALHWPNPTGRAQAEETCDIIHRGQPPKAESRTGSRTEEWTEDVKGKHPARMYMWKTSQGMNFCFLQWIGR